METNIHKIILMCLTGMAVLEVLLLISLGILWKIQLNNILQGRKIEFCLSEDPFRIEQTHSSFDRRYRNDEANSKVTSCWPLTEYLVKVGNKTLAEKYDRYAASELLQRDNFFKSMNCRVVKQSTVHIQLWEFSTYGPPVPPTKLYWTSSVNENKTAYFRHLPREGEILVLKEGIYFISSHVTVKIDDQFTHYVILVSGMDHSEQAIFENKISKCNSRTQYSETTSKIEASFRLKKNDRIYIAVTKAHFLVNEYRKSSLSMWVLHEL